MRRTNSPRKDATTMYIHQGAREEDTARPSDREETKRGGFWRGTYRVMDCPKDFA